MMRKATRKSTILIKAGHRKGTTASRSRAEQRGKRKRRSRAGKGKPAIDAGQIASGSKEGSPVPGIRRPLSSTENAARLKAARMEKRIDQLLWR